MGIGSSRTSGDPVIKGSGSHNQIVVADSALKLKNGTAVQDRMNSVGKSASKVIESGGNIITAPAVWLKDIQQNCLTYMVLIAIILSILVFFYCSFSFYLNRKKNNSSNSNLIELAKIINNKNGIIQQQLPLSMINLPSVSSRTPAE